MCEGETICGFPLRVKIGHRLSNLHMVSVPTGSPKTKDAILASFVFGEPSGIRTPGPLIKSQMLCRLS